MGIIEEVIRHMDFVNDVALAFIAFGVGRYFKLSALKKSGAKVIAITLAESLVAAAAVTLTMIFIFRLPCPSRCCSARSAAPQRPPPPS